MHVQSMITPGIQCCMCKSHPLDDNSYPNGRFRSKTRQGSCISTAAIRFGVLSRVSLAWSVRTLRERLTLEQCPRVISVFPKMPLNLMFLSPAFSLYYLSIDSVLSRLTRARSQGKILKRDNEKLLKYPLGMGYWNPRACIGE